MFCYWWFEIAICMLRAHGFVKKKLCRRKDKKKLKTLIGLTLSYTHASRSNYVELVWVQLMPVNNDSGCIISLGVIVYVNSLSLVFHHLIQLQNQ